MSLLELTFKLSTWENTHKHITDVRKQVFFNEQHLPINFIRHKDDAERYHVVAYEDLTGIPVGTGCIHGDGHIGRIAILPYWNQTNSVAHVIVDYLFHIAKAQKMERVWLNAPTDTLDYFDRHNFFPKGDLFKYCGIPMMKIEACLEVSIYRHKKADSKLHVVQ